MELEKKFRRKIKLAYEQAPWRIELRLGATLLLIVVIASALAAFYTDISARTVALGRKMQNMQVSASGAYSLRYVPDPATVEPMEELNMQIAALRLQLAQSTSLQVMQHQMDLAGYQQADSENVIYLAVPGYVPEQTAQLGSQSNLVIVSAVTTTPYRDSLLDALQGGWRSLTDMIQKGNLP